ncbi:MAG: hypothetical protein U0136_06815 [Bdellovibrionota bacterium]
MGQTVAVTVAYVLLLLLARRVNQVLDSRRVRVRTGQIVRFVPRKL